VHEFTRKRLAMTGFLALPTTHEHGLIAGELPAYHRDPFDRLLIAQAQTEGLVLINSDKVILQYSVQTFWASK
jgi:PIN domain nuclease of toxin-antitoxin system